MDAEEQIEIIEITIEKAKYFVESGKSMQNLLNNSDFKMVFIEGYMEKEAIRLVKFKADVNAQKPETQMDILKDIDAIGAFNQFIINIQKRGQMALETISQNEIAREEILDEINN